MSKESSLFEKSKHMLGVSLLILAALLVPFSTAAAASNIMINDDFNDGSFNTNLWGIETITGGTVSQTGSYLELATQAGVALSIPAISPLITMAGDLDVDVDFDLIAFDRYYGNAVLKVASCDDNYMMNIYVSSLGGGQKYYESTYRLSGILYTPAGYYTPYGNGSTTGRLRITRSGNLLTSYYWKDASWRQLMSAVVFNGPAIIKLQTGSYTPGDPSSTPSVVVHWDNFQAQAKGVAAFCTN